MQMAWGYAPALMIEAGVRHRVFDILDDGPQTVETMAVLSGASRRGVRALMNALAGFGLLIKGGDGQFSLSSDAAAFLVSAKPGFVGGMSRHAVEQMIPAWLHLSDIVRTGKPAESVNQQKAGTEFFEKFVEDIFPMSYPSARALAAALDLAAREGDGRGLAGRARGDPQSGCPPRPRRSLRVRRRGSRPGRFRLRLRHRHPGSHPA
jgi:hypothetical protein